MHSVKQLGMRTKGQNSSACNKDYINCVKGGGEEEVLGGRGEHGEGEGVRGCWGGGGGCGAAGAPERCGVVAAEV